MVAQRRLVDRRHARGVDAAMAADQRRHDRRLVIDIEIGPVHDDDDIRRDPTASATHGFELRRHLDPGFDRIRSTCLMACFGSRARADASPCPIVFTGQRGLLTTPGVAFADEELSRVDLLPG